MKNENMAELIESYKKNNQCAEPNQCEEDSPGDPAYQETPEHINEARKGDCCYCEQEMDEYRKRHPLEQAIRCWAFNKNGKKHLHQRRVYNESIKSLIMDALKRIAEVRQCQTFHALYGLTQSIRPSGIGPLSTYDFALRVGMSLGLEPIYIYIHAGARIGAEKLLGKDKVNNREYLQLEEIPEPLRYLEPYHIENFLCIYKGELSKIED